MRVVSTSDVSNESRAASVFRAFGKASILAGFVVAAGAARADLVANWDEVATNTINAAGFPATTPEERRPLYQVDLATVHVALHDSVVAIAGEYRPFAIRPTSPAAGASIESAAGSAACRVLQVLFPSRATVYSAACANYRLTSPGTQQQLQGVVLGVEVAEGVLALRANDGRATNAAYTQTGAPGNFAPTASPPANVFLPFMRPFVMSSAQQFRAYGPPGLGSARYAQDLNEVKALGSATSTTRTSAQSELARFATEPPPRFWPRTYRRFVDDSKPVLQNARLMAMLWVAHADAIQSCFESKYAYAFWRPRTAIPGADADGNPATAADPTWTPFVPTPNHPEYPAAHSCSAGATGEVLRQVFGTKHVEFDADSTVTGTVRQYENTDDFVRDMGLARIYGGMHYRASTEHGAHLGKEVAKLVAGRFRQVRGRR